MGAIKHIRESAGLTQRQCAKKARVTQSRWSQWETACPRIMLPTFMRICSVLDIKPSAMIQLLEKE